MATVTADAAARARMPATSGALLNDRYNIVVLLDATMSNPNGDPDAANQPRQDPVTGEGIISNVCLKRKVRDYLTEVRGVSLYHANGVVLRDQRVEALRAQGIEPSAESDDGGGGDGASEEEAQPRQGRKAAGARQQRTTRAAVSAEDLRRNQRVICERFFDARTFGALMDTGAARAANARGPVAVSQALSLDPVRIIELSITRQSVESPDERGKERMMGSQSVVRYGLYRFDVTVHPFFAHRTGFSEADLGLLKDALVNAFEFDQSANRLLTTRGIYAFRHVSQDGKPCLGHASRASLLDRVVVHKREGVDEPRSFGDYQVEVNKEGLAKGVLFERWA